MINTKMSLCQKKKTQLLMIETYYNFNFKIMIAIYQISTSVFCEFFFSYLTCEWDKNTYLEKFLW